MVGDHFVNSSSCNVISGCVNPACTQRVRRLCSPELLMANTFLMNEVPLSVSHFLYFDLLPLGFNEQELSRKVRISVICPEERGVEGAYVCMCTCIHVCKYVCTCVFVWCTRMYPCVCVCVHL